MTVNISFYLIAIRAQRVKKTAKQAIFVSKSVKKSVSVSYAREGCETVLQSTCEKSFLTGKECPVECAHCDHHVKKRKLYIFTRTERIYNAISDKNSHTIFWRAEGFGEGCVKITLIVSCLLIFIQNGGI